MKKLLIIFVFITANTFSHAQSVTDILSNSENNLTENLSTETVEKISSSRRILVLTNNNSSFDRGDFISLIFANDLAVRGLVAKIDDQKAAFKITKIYSIPLWKSMRQGLEVKVIRGDDSYFNKKGDKEEAQELANGGIQSEDDLYNETTMLDEDIKIEDKSKRVIQTDNIVGMNYGYLLSSQDTEGNSANYTHPNLSWMYQFKDNIWAEFSLGFSTIENYPTDGLSTSLTTYTLKAKYAFETPFYSYTLPYIGYHVRSASSDSAGVRGDGESTTDVTDEDLANEISLVNALEEVDNSGIVLGVTILKRLVPGWFARFDIGTDIINLGIALEF